MENVDLMHAIWGGVVAAFSFLGKKILADYDEKFKTMMRTLEKIDSLTMEMNIKLARMESKLESKAERLLRRAQDV